MSGLRSWLAGLAGPPRPGVVEARRRWLASVMTLCLVVLLVAIVALALRQLHRLDFVAGAFFQLGLVGLFAAAVGFAELITRYKDDPIRLSGSLGAQVYILVNVAAGLGALALVQEFRVFGPYAPGDHHAVYEVMLAGFGSVAFFRTSLFTARVGEVDIGIGPSTLLKALLETSDRIADRGQARDRAEEIGRVMRDIDFDRVKGSLPVLCLSLVQNLPEAQQQELGTQVAKLITDDPNRPPISPRDKSAILGVYLLQQVGAPVLRSALDILRANAAAEAAAKPNPAPIPGRP